MGVGKSSTASKLANKLGWEKVDLDKQVELKQGKSIAAIFEQEGESAFREMEWQALQEIELHHKVVAVGGGTPTHHNSAEWMLQRGLCIWLDAPILMLVNRLAHAKTNRPLLAGLGEEEMAKRLTELNAEREPFYSKAHMILNVQKLEIPAIATIVSGIIQDKSRE